MKQCLLLLMCLCCFSLILPAQSSQKQLGDRDQTQQYLEDHFLDNPAFGEMRELLKTQPDGIWSLLEEEGKLSFSLDDQLVFQLENHSIENEEEDEKSLTTFQAQAVSLKHASLDQTFYKYEVYQLDAKAIRNLASRKNGGKLQFRLQLGQEHNWLLRLQPNELFTPGLQAKALTERGTEYYTLPTNILYREQKGLDESQRARFSITDDYIVGAVMIDGEEYFIEPLPTVLAAKSEGLYMVYRSSDVLPNPAMTCAKTTAEKYTPQPPAHLEKMAPDPGCYEVAELALAADFDMYTRYVTFGATVQHMLDITNLMEVLYEPVQIDYRIVDIFVATSDAADPWTASDDAFTILTSFSAWAELNFAPHDVGQIWVTRDIQGCGSGPGNFGLVGCAEAIGDICGPERYNVCEDIAASGFNCLRALSAHELGHLWDGVHSQAVDNVTIMFENIVCGATAFSAGNTTRINNHRDARVCLEEACCRLVVDCSNIFDQDLECQSDLPSVDFDLPIIDESCGNVVRSSLTIIPGDSGCPGDEVLINRTYFILDDEGNTFRCHQDFTVESTMGPSITCPANFEVDLDANCEFALPNYSGLASASASCSNFSISVSQVSPAPATVYSAEADVLVTLRATDGCGRIKDCSFTVFVRDNTPPMITSCDGGTMVFDGEDNQLSSSAINLVADDNCGIASIEYDPEFIYCDQLGENVPVEITVTDINGNPSVCNTTVLVDGLPCGWMQAYVGCSGDISYDVANEIFTLESDNCYYTSPFNQDQLTFAKYELCGNGSITAEVSALAVQGWAGVTMRETLAAGSKKVQLMNNGANLARREIRNVTNGSAYPQQFPSFNRKWVRLVRNGNQFIGYISPNGINWQQVMVANISMADCIQIGLVTTNFNALNPVTASFSHVVVDPPYMGGGALAAPTTVPELILQAEQTDYYTVALFPNPTAGKISLDLANFQNKKVQLSILNSNGQQQWQRQLNAVENQREILQLEELPVGVYWLRIQLEDEPAIMRRIVITRP